MKTSIKTVAGKRFVVVDTEIAKDAYRADITKLNVVTDKEFGTEFVMTVDMDAPVGKVSGFGVTVNGVTDDGNFAAVIPVAIYAGSNPVVVISTIKYTQRKENNYEI